MANEDDSKPLDINEDILARVETRVERTEFETSKEYVTYILEEVLTHAESEVDDNFDADDETAVKDRLKSLGYLNE